MALRDVRCAREPLSSSPVTSPKPVDLPISKIEFIALAAFLTCLTALSIDILLPVLPELARGLRLTNPNDQQWVITSYLGGLVIGQIFVGSVSDRLGRLPILFAGLALFIAGAAVASLTGSFEALLIARVLQGMGGAAPRIVVMAVVRDLFEGRQMARTMSLVMTTFIMVPIFAPAVGQLLGFVWGWRAPIMLLAVFGVLATLWAWIRLPETSPHHRADAIEMADDVGSRLTLLQAVLAVCRTRMAVGYVIANGFMFSCLMSYILSAQQIFVDVYQLGGMFPLAFGSIAVGVAIAGIVNSRIVVRLGMRYVSHRALVAFLVVAIVMALLSLAYAGRPPFWILWTGLWMQFFFFGLIVSNFNALAMEPLGHVAGTASSMMGTYTTLCGAFFGTLIGQAFNMTALPMNIGFAVFSLAAFIIVLMTERGNVFRR